MIRDPLLNEAFETWKKSLGTGTEGFQVTMPLDEYVQRAFIAGAAWEREASSSQSRIVFDPQWFDVEEHNARDGGLDGLEQAVIGAAVNLFYESGSRMPLREKDLWLTEDRMSKLRERVDCLIAAMPGTGMVARSADFVPLPFDTQELLTKLYVIYCRLERLLLTVGSLGLKPSRVLEMLCEDLVPNKTLRFCLGYGEGHLWAPNDDQVFPTSEWEWRCRIHPDRRSKERRK